MVWYQELSVNRRDWIISHFNRLNLTVQEFLIVLKIDAANQLNINIDNEYLSEETNLETSEVDHIIRNLVTKKLLTIRSTRKSIEFDLSNLFNLNVDSQQKSDFVENFEQEFGRPLTQHEMENLSELIDKYDQQLVEYALRQASLRNKLSMNYVERILQNEAHSK